MSDWFNMIGVGILVLRGEKYQRVLEVRHSAMSLTELLFNVIHSAERVRVLKLHTLLLLNRY